MGSNEKLQKEQDRVGQMWTLWKGELYPGDDTLWLWPCSQGVRKGVQSVKPWLHVK